MMIRKTLMLACAVSVLGLGAAFAQTDPAAPAAPAASAPAGDASGDAMAPKKMMKKKHMAKKKHMMKKDAM